MGLAVYSEKCNSEIIFDLSSNVSTYSMLGGWDVENISWTDWNWHDGNWHDGNWHDGNWANYG